MGIVFQVGQGPGRKNQAPPLIESDATKQSPVPVIGRGKIDGNEVSIGRDVFGGSLGQQGFIRHRLGNKVCF